MLLQGIQALIQPDEGSRLYGAEAGVAELLGQFFDRDQRSWVAAEQAVVVEPLADNGVQAIGPLEQLRLRLHAVAMG